MSKYAYINGIILDGSEDMKPQRDMVILTENDRIKAIIPRTERRASGTGLSGYEVIDLAGQYICPGLINLHVHLPASGKPKKKQTDTVKLVKLMTSNALMRRIVVKMCTGYARTELLSGVTTIRTVGGILNTDSKIRDMINSGKLIGPRILASNMAVSVAGGHMAGSLGMIAASAEEAAELVRRIAEDKPDLIKLMITGGVLDAKVKGEPGELKMPAEFVKRACEEAHKLGLKVAAHVESPEGVRIALENGVDTIEHGAKPDERIIELFRKRGASLVTTLSPALPYAFFDRKISHASEMEQYNGDVVFEGIKDCAITCLKNGIPVGLGTDTGCPYVTHYDCWRELNYFSKYCGVTNSFALYTATKRNALIAGIADETGSIEPGKCADFIVVGENPLEKLEALRHVNMVVVRGQVIKLPRVKKMMEAEVELDKFK